MSDEELWARSYAQYIAKKSGNQDMNAQLAEMQESPFPSQWSDDDFAPIMEAIDGIFRAKGWIE